MSGEKNLAIRKTDRWKANTETDDAIGRYQLEH
jgi:hypothetical protein